MSVKMRSKFKSVSRHVDDKMFSYTRWGGVRQPREACLHSDCHLCCFISESL